MVVIDGIVLGIMVIVVVGAVGNNVGTIRRGRRSPSFPLFSPEVRSPHGVEVRIVKGSLLFVVNSSNGLFER